MEVLQGHLTPGWGTVLELLAVWKCWILWDQAENSSQTHSSSSQTPKLLCLISNHTSHGMGLDQLHLIPRTLNFLLELEFTLFGNVPSLLSLFQSPTDAHLTFLVL